MVKITVDYSYWQECCEKSEITQVEAMSIKLYLCQWDALSVFSSWQGNQKVGFKKQNENFIQKQYHFPVLSQLLLIKQNKAKQTNYKNPKENILDFQCSSHPISYDGILFSALLECKKIKIKNSMEHFSIRNQASFI